MSTKRKKQSSIPLWQNMSVVDNTPIHVIWKSRPKTHGNKYKQIINYKAYLAKRNINSHSLGKMPCLETWAYNQSLYLAIIKTYYILKINKIKVTTLIILLVYLYLAIIKRYYVINTNKINVTTLTPWTRLMW